MSSQLEQENHAQNWERDGRDAVRKMKGDHETCANAQTPTNTPDII